MKRHTRIYLRHFGYNEFEPEFIKCECPDCNEQALDIHHLDSRGMGGDPTASKDRIENLMALCRKHHNQADFPDFNAKLKRWHAEHLRLHASYAHR